MRPILPLRCVFAAVSLCCVSFAAESQLYTWKDAGGNTVIKNSPPPWYSATDRGRGARVQVLRNGKVIDDTAWPAQRRQDGRNQDARDEAKRAQSEPAPRVDSPSKGDSDDD